MVPTQGVIRSRHALAGATVAALVVLVAACGGGSGSAGARATTTTRAAVALEANSGRTNGTSPPGHLAIPLRVETIGTATRAIAQVSVGHGPVIPVLLDTGSAGLRVLPDAIGSDEFPTGATTTSTFGSGGGVQVTGRVSNAPLTIDGVTTGTIGVEVMERACRKGGGCEPASSLTNLLSGTKGILGIGLANGASPATPISSPLLQLRAPYSDGYVLQLGPNGNGTLTLGPVQPSGTPLPLQPATPNRYPNGATAYQKDVRLCWTVADAHACGQTDFDIGAPNVIVTPTAMPGLPSSGGALPTGTMATLATPSGATLWSFTATPLPSSTAIRYAALPGSYTMFNTGVGFELSHTLAFDLVHGTLYVTPS